MSGSEPAGREETATLEVYPVVAEAMRTAAARDSYFGTDAIIGAVRQALAAWVAAVDGDETALAAIAEPQAAHFLIHPAPGGSPTPARMPARTRARPPSPACWI
jgi:hypothetical protein